MNKKLLPILMLLLLSLSTQAQSLSALLKNAEVAEKAGHFMIAAELWERAGRLKDSDPSLLHRAAENYARARDYRRAADCYQGALADDRFPLAALRYARSLKQQGRFEEAKNGFDRFAQQYHGEFKAMMISIAELEIDGCKLALQLYGNRDTTLLFPVIQDSINSPENEFAAIPFSEQLLYFSRAFGPQVKLMRSKRVGTQLSFPEEATSLPESVSGKFYSGCFAPDGSRFYYTQCDQGCPAEKGGSVTQGPCSIFCIRRTEAGWATPERLWPYINLDGSTSLFPQVAQTGGLEYLFFSSDRAGGFGGLDLYVCERTRESEALDFSFPQNLGSKVNTGADEVTPFYQADAQILWFSSFGHPTLGGYDIYKTEKVTGGWSKPEHAGLPFNSPADDYFLVIKKSGEGAFLSSNRSMEGIKMNTLDDDIFELKEY
jgi:hypothetical protein